MFFLRQLRLPHKLPFKSSRHSHRFSFTPKSPTPQKSTYHARLHRLHSRLPRFLHPYTSTLLTSPSSSIISFLVLHEITAIVPLIGLASAFHFGGWLPQTWTEARYVREGIERFGRYFGGKGWFGFTRVQNRRDEDVGDTIQKGNGVIGEAEGAGIQQQRIEQVEDRWGVSESSGRILVEVATAYAITKVFLPARIVLSVWATPWFARVVVGRIGGRVGKLFGKRGTGVVDAGEKAVGKTLKGP